MRDSSCCFDRSRSRAHLRLVEVEGGAVRWWEAGQRQPCRKMVEGSGGRNQRTAAMAMIGGRSSAETLLGEAGPTMSSCWSDWG